MKPDEAVDPYQSHVAKEQQRKLAEADALLARSSAKFARLAAKIEKLKGDQ